MCRVLRINPLDCQLHPTLTVAFRAAWWKIGRPYAFGSFTDGKAIPWHRSPMTFQSIFIIIFEHLGLGVDDFSALRNWDVKA
jgi:hypothetical protein